MSPWTTALQAPLSRGFSRQEYWSGLPCPPPGDLPNPGIKPRSPTLQADSFLSEPPGKPKNTGVGSLSLLQQIFSSQESNLGLLNCKWILYQLSYREAPLDHQWLRIFVFLTLYFLSFGCDFTLFNRAVYSIAYSFIFRLLILDIHISGINVCYYVHKRGLLFLKRLFDSFPARSLFFLR